MRYTFTEFALTLFVVLFTTLLWLAAFKGQSLEALIFTCHC